MEPAVGLTIEMPTYLKRKYEESPRERAANRFRKSGAELHSDGVGTEVGQEWRG